MTQQQFIDSRMFSRLEEYVGHVYVAEASELHWAPGQWPTVFKTNLGNMLPMVLQSVTHDGVRIYAQVAGCIEIRVLNS